jgi:hypothetical protein
MIPMRRRTLLSTLLAVGLTLAVAVPAAYSSRGKPKPRGQDGTLSIEDGKGTVQIAARGSVLGQLDNGRLIVTDTKPYDQKRPTIRGATWHRRRSRTTVEYGGRDLHYRIAGGFYRIKIVGLGIDLSAVGRGSVTLQGDARYADTGLYSLNGAEFVPVPYERTTLQLGPLASQ